MRKRILFGFVLMLGLIVSKGQQETKTTGSPLLKASTTAEKPQPAGRVPGDPRLTKMSTTPNDSFNTVNPNIIKSETKINKAVIDK